MILCNERLLMTPTSFACGVRQLTAEFGVELMGGARVATEVAVAASSCSISIREFLLVLYDTHIMLNNYSRVSIGII